MQSGSQDSIELRLDLQTAELLFDVLYAGGEHQAAGAEMPQLDSTQSIRLAKVMDDLKNAIAAYGENARQG